jgi:hypothetical protein
MLTRFLYRFGCGFIGFSFALVGPFLTFHNQRPVFVDSETKLRKEINDLRTEIAEFNTCHPDADKPMPSFAWGSRPHEGVEGDSVGRHPHLPHEERPTNRLRTG